MGMPGRPRVFFVLLLRASGRAAAPYQDLLKKPPIVVLREQPPFVPPLNTHPQWAPYRPSTRASEREKAPRKSSISGRSSFSVRKRFLANTSSRRPHISAPTNFRHLNSESFQFPQYPDAPRRPRPASFRPLELSIYLPENELSPILPHFDYESIITPLPPAHIQRRPSQEDGTFTLGHERSYSSVSFHVPRRSPSTTLGETPKIPTKSRARAYTSPDIDKMVERIASAMLEVERLQDQIDDVIERQSVYISSRPSTAHSMARTLSDLEPMPSIPALPPAAPSFAERLGTPVSATEEARPHTAPVKSPVHIPSRAKTFNEASAPFNGPPSSTSRVRTDRPPPPPLPLVLRPPLRKKKSFSRVSTWLFPDGAGHSRDISIDSITNLPRTVKGREGFYQCVSPAEGKASGKRSFDTVSTLSTWETEDEDRTAPTTAWSPESSPATKGPATRKDESPLERTTASLGAGLGGPSASRLSRVGVAF